MLETKMQIVNNEMQIASMHESRRDWLICERDAEYDIKAIINTRGRANSVLWIF